MFLNYDNTGVTVELGEIVASGVNIWDFDYPVPRSEIQYNGKSCKVDFDKTTFEQKFIDHYRFRQIGQETVGRWLHYFRSRMREIMPYYVQVYEFDAKFRNIEDPLESYNLVEEFEQATEGTGRSSGTSSGTSSEQTSSETGGTTGGTLTRSSTMNKLSKFSDTPQGSISNLDNYLTNATQDSGSDSATEQSTGTNTGTSSGSSSGTSSGETSQTTEDTGKTSHKLTRRGNIGVQPLGGEVMNIRSAFINIDMQIIEELHDLFLMVY